MERAVGVGTSLGSEGWGAVLGLVIGKLPPPTPPPRKGGHQF